MQPRYPSQVLAPPPRLTLRRARLRDTTFVVNLILAEAAEGRFSNLYLRPQYLAGLVLQVARATVLRSTKINGRRAAASLQVLEDEAHRPLAFLWSLRGDDGQPAEIFMMAVAPEARGRGAGSFLVRASVAALPPQSIIVADCLPAAQAMQRLLRRHGFQGGSPRKAAAHEIAPRRYVLKA
jgi:ribosomal protein S18 acetylase RimI-like enzyme